MQRSAVEREARFQAALLKDSKTWATGVPILGTFSNVVFLRRASIYHDFMYWARAQGMLNEPVYDTSVLPDRGWLEIALEDAGFNPAKIALALAGYPIIRAYGILEWPPAPDLAEVEGKG